MRWLSIVTCGWLLAAPLQADSTTWVGREAMPRQQGLKMRDETLRRFIAPLNEASYTVLNEKNDWIYINQQGVAGWINKKEAVLVDEGVAYFTKRLQVNARDDYAWAQRSWALCRQKQLDKGLEDINRALQLNPRMATWYLYRAAIWLEKQDFARARADCETALKLKPKETPLLPPVPDQIVGQSLPMQTVFKRIALVASRDDTCVLITGESGSGKEMVARAIHRHSPRRDGPFLPIHIASLNPNLVESELFGHSRGAFTGAEENRPGLLQLAEGGTVLIDELADIPLPVQVKLLRVLEQNEVLPVGSNKSERIDVRILSATQGVGG